MTSKERAAWRSKANSLKPLFQVGKEGLSDEFIKQADDALTARELIKLRVLIETSPESPKDIAAKVAQATGSEVIQVVGGSMVFYRYNPELHKKPKKVKVKKASAYKSPYDSRNKRTYKAKKKR